MIDWNALEELYSASQSASEKVRGAAVAVIESHFDEWFGEYLQLPSNLYDWGGKPGSAFQYVKKGEPRWKTYDELASFLLMWLNRKPGESSQELHEREEKLRADRLGVLIRHYKHGKARTLRKTDFDYTILYGDQFSLDLWPAHGKELGLPEPTPNEVILP